MAVRACDSISDYFATCRKGDVLVFPESSASALPEAIVSRFATVALEGPQAYVDLCALWVAGCTAEPDVERFVGAIEGLAR